MAIKETKNRTEMLKYLADTATANSETDVEEFLKIFNPAPSRKEMGEIFEANLGFDPITHYDIQDVIKAVDEVMDHVSRDGMEILVSKKDEIVEKTMAVVESRRDDFLRECLLVALGDYLDSDDIQVASTVLTGSTSALEDLFPIGDEDVDDDEDDLTHEMNELENDNSLDPINLDDDENDGSPEFEFDADEDEDD
mgnify:FL=1|jgi:hypothetical protein